MSTKFFWGAGYNVVESFLTTFDPKRVEIDSEATFKRPNGKRTPATRRDIEQVLERAARNPDGTYRGDRGPSDSRPDPRQVPLRGNTSGRSERSRAAPASARAARALRVRRLDEHDGLQGREHDGHAGARGRPHGREALPSGRGVDVRRGQRYSPARPRVGALHPNGQRHEAHRPPSGSRWPRGRRSSTRPAGRRSATSRAIASIRGSGAPILPTPRRSRCATTMRSGPPGGSPRSTRR